MNNEKKKDQLVKMLGITQSRNAQAIIVGEAKYHADLIRELPVVDVCDWFERPVDMTKFANSVEKALKDYENRLIRKKILIVDDDPSYAAMVREWIKDSYQVGIVSNGMQAITYLIEKPVDLILLDYEMPVVDGPQVLEMLRTVFESGAEVIGMDICGELSGAKGGHAEDFGVNLKTNMAIQAFISDYNYD